MKKIIYVNASTDSLTLDLCEYYKNEAIPILSSVLERIELKTPEDQHISVEILIDVWARGNPKFVNASAKDLGQNKYLIELGVGLIARLHFICRAIAADPSALKGHRGRLLTQKLKQDGHEKILSDFAFNYMLTFLCWHEVAHILLGHLDWRSIQLEKQLSELNNPPFSADMLATRRALEGDADLHAAKITAARMDVSLSKNRCLQYVCAEDIFYDIGYIFGAFFQLLDSLDNGHPDTKKAHPHALKRSAVAWTSVKEYLEIHRPSNVNQLHNAVYIGGLESLGHIIHENKSPFDLLETAKYIAQTGDLIDKADVKRYRKKIQQSSSSSFKIM